MLTVGSLFTGIGGFDLGLERAGMRVLWQCESDDYCRRVLAHHWPNVPCYDDVRQLRGTGRQVEPVDVLCGGFPCQDLSVAGKGAGIDGARSGLWSEYARLIGELRPRYVIVENVSALLGRGLGRVLGDLSEVGYDAEWDCLPACAFGAPHQRDRVWLVAYPGGDDGVADPDSSRPAHLREGEARRRVVSSRPGMGATAGGSGEPGWSTSEWWATEPDVGRVAHGVPARVDRLRSLGTALVPQIAEWIGQRIVTWEHGQW